MRVERTSVLVVGAGPVGTILALELHRHGVGCIVVDGALATATYPRTCYINSRSMELLRRLGLAETIREHGTSPDHTPDLQWVNNLDDLPVLVWHHPSVSNLRRRYASMNDGNAPAEPYQLVSSDALERLGRERLLEHSIDLRLGSELTDLDATSRDIRASIRHRDGQDYSIRADHVAGCDGAQSLVRALLDIDMDEQEASRDFRSVHFLSADPSLDRFGPASTTVGPSEITLSAHGGSKSWTASMPLALACERDPLQPVRAGLRASFKADRILGMETWQGSLSVAKQFSRGRVHLAGDAAHGFYPIGGYGENTGIGDAVNLGWKLAAAVQQWGGPRLLHSYEQERRPIALFNRELNADLVAAGRRYARLLAAGASREQLAGILEQDVHRIDDLGVQLGYRYDGSTVVWHEPDGEPPLWQWSELSASTWPGVRAPAVRTANGMQLYDQLGRGFTLVDMTTRGDGDVLVQTAKERQVPMTHLRVRDPAVLACWERELVLIRPDQHVAWRGREAPDNWDAVLQKVTGRSTTLLPAVSSRRSP